MTFKVFKKTGELRNIHGDWDGDDGYDVEIEIAEEKVHRDIAEMIYNDYILRAMPLDCEWEIDTLAVREQIEKVINELDCWDKATKLYFETLQEKYADEL